jgi:hypothetical protein
MDLNDLKSARLRIIVILYRKKGAEKNLAQFKWYRSKSNEKAGNVKRWEYKYVIDKLTWFFLLIRFS